MTTPAPKGERSTRERRSKAASSSPATANGNGPGKAQGQKETKRSRAQSPAAAPPPVAGTLPSAEAAPGSAAQKETDPELVLQEAWLECVCLEALARAMQREFEFLAPGRTPEERRAGDRLYGLLMLVAQRAELALQAVEAGLGAPAGAKELDE